MDTTSTIQYKPVNLAGLYWVTNGRVASFGAARPGYGVEVVATGEVLARAGQPAVWTLLSTAATIAEHAEGLTRYSPMPVYRTAEDARAVTKIGAPCQAVTALPPKRSTR